MLSHVLPIVVVSLSLTGLGIGAPVSGVADTPALESKQAKGGLPENRLIYEEIWAH